MVAPKQKFLHKNKFFQSAIIIGLIVAIIVVFFYGSQLVLNTPYPTLIVETGSMCIPCAASCDGWLHPFSRTLHIGDLLIIQGLKVSEINTNYPDSDIIVFHKPGDYETLVVHRIVTVQEKNGTLFFQTKGDGNVGISGCWPSQPSVSEYDPWSGGKGVPEDLIVGKVVARIPWVGFVILFIKQNPIGLPLIIILIILLIVLEYIFPILKKISVQQKVRKV